jgi:nucleoside-diphosphate-sugar epimerase
MEKIKMEKILITGGSGFIGTNAVEHFLQRGYEVVNYDIRPPQNELHKHFWIEGNINDKEAYFEAVQKFAPAFVFHLAARTDLLETKNINGYKPNIDGVLNTIEIVNAVDSIKRVLFASSRMVCRIDYIPKDFEDYCPPNFYGESKMLGEKIVRSAKLNKEWVLFRPTSIWGPWFDIPYIIFFRSIQRNLYFNPGKHNPQKSFGYVKNAVYQLEKIMKASSQDVHGKTIYLFDYPPLNLKQWAELIQRAMRTKKISTYPFWLLKIGAYTGDVLYTLGWKRAPITSFRLNNLITNMVYDTTELEKICGPLPYDLETGAVETVRWMTTHTSRDALANIK